MGFLHSIFNYVECDSSCVAISLAVDDFQFYKHDGRYFLIYDIQFDTLIQAGAQILFLLQH